MLGNLISAGASLAGGLINAENAEDARYAQAHHNAENIRLQKKFAQEGIQWRVQDAKKAGIHPIYALGSSGASFTPTSSNFSADTSLGSAMASAGQDIGRAINATQSGSDRASAFTKAAQALELEKGSLGNEILRLEIASKMGRLRQENAPAMPIGDRHLIPGQGNTLAGSNIKTEPMERVASDPNQKYSEPGAINDRGFARTSGGLFPVPSKDVKERTEDNWYQETMHFIRNNLLPMIAPAFNDPPNTPIDKDKAWVYDPVYGYKQVPNKWHRKFLRY